MNIETLKLQEIKINDLTLRFITDVSQYAQDIFNEFHNDAENMIFFMPDGLYDSLDAVFQDYNQRKLSSRIMMFGIFRDSELLGEIGFTTIARKSGKVEIGYWLKKSARGHGIIDTLIPTIEKMAFDQDWCHKIQIHCDSKNIPSIKIAENNGYILEGVIRQDAKWPDGSLRDKLYFGKLKQDYLHCN